MYLKTFYDDALAQASYLIGSTDCHEALIIDPARDITPYLDAALAQGLRIVQIAETHIHADFVSGSRELAARTGAQLYLSGMGGADWPYAYADAATRLLCDGDAWLLGEIRIEALHMPGHTPEHLIFRVTDTAHADEPMGLFTGDCLFVGDVGRPDLLETAAGEFGSSEEAARQQFASVQRLKVMPDFLQVWPGHGAGSACGKALGAVPSTTLGYEKRFNPAFQQPTETEFVSWLLDGQPEMPPYFRQMKRVNRQGPALLAELSPVEPSEGFVLADALRTGAFIVDARSAEEYRYAHVPGTLSVPLAGKFSTYSGDFVDYTRPVYLILEANALERALRDLRAIGVDDVRGYFPNREIGDYAEPLAALAPADAVDSNRVLVDVRGESEVREQRIAGAIHLPLPELSARVNELPRSQPLLTVCTSGERSHVAASFLQMQGFADVATLSGGLDAWQDAGLPVEVSEAETQVGAASN